MALVVFVAADFVIYSALQSYLYQQVDATLEQSHIPIEALVSGGGNASGGGGGPQPGGGPPGSGQPTESTSFCSSHEMQEAPGTFVQVRNSQNDIVAGETCSAIEPGGKAYEPALPAKITGFSSNSADFGEPTVYFTAPSSTAGGPTFRVRASQLRDGGGQLIVAVPIESQASTLARLRYLEIAVTAGALLIAIVLGWWFLRLGLRPLRDVERTAGAIAGGDLENRVPNPNPRTEVGQVATALNVMLERIEGAFSERDATEAELRESEDRMRRFVADASHELRTPIAAVSAYAQLYDQGAASRQDDLDRSMSGIRTETARMGRLVEDLLLLARLDEHRAFERRPVELVDLAIEAIDTARTVGPEWPLRLEATGPVEVSGDRVTLRQVLDNLLANVRAHTPAGTAATVRVAEEGGEAVLEVSDEGPGITAAEATLIFERFFRADSSRSRKTGGAGLGLAIVASIAAAHGGRAEAAGREGGGSVFRVVLPAVAVEQSEAPAGG